MMDPVGLAIERHYTPTDARQVETFGNPWTLKFSARAWFARDRP